jgi:DNA-directed RNA polymerase specialized sigma24 family protein
MQEEEARDLLTRYHKDDDQAAFNAFYAVVTKKCRRMLTSCFRGNAELNEEVIQQGMIHIITRMRDRNFIPDKPLAYLSAVVYTARLLAKRRERLYISDVESEINVPTPGDSDPIDVMYAASLLERFSLETQQMMYSRLVLRKSWAVIGTEVGMSGRKVSRKVQAAMRELAGLPPIESVKKKRDANALSAAAASKKQAA